MSKKFLFGLFIFGSYLLSGLKPVMLKTSRERNLPGCVALSFMLPLIDFLTDFGTDFQIVVQTDFRKDF